MTEFEERMFWIEVTAQKLSDAISELRCVLQESGVINA